DLLAKRVSLCAPSATVEHYSVERTFSCRLLSVVPEQLPKGLSSCDPDTSWPLPGERQTVAALGALASCIDGRVIFKGDDGSLESRCYKADERARLAEPSETELAAFKTVWLGERMAVSLTIEGHLPVETVAWVEQFVSDELARCVDMKGARVLHGEFATK